MPDVEEVIDAELNYKFACSGYDVRKFVATALEDVEGMDELVNDVLAAVDAAEKQSGRELDGDNHQGWEVSPGGAAGGGAGGAEERGRAGAGSWAFLPSAGWLGAGWGPGAGPGPGSSGR